ncbi:uncharacterized protein LOC115005927 isoform X5 [Cottoperca gobio]|uniref:Uncharacterized protein LOC115005927 isoform X5 n=1 Tax=Cottoperca gobio TaxID=56716 RepID=A0A6J2PF52_COTGO|nr:uncharacterized protein LOC115005927 isoform X5 [Cottoperca gobio]
MNRTHGEPEEGASLGATGYDADTEDTHDADTKDTHDACVLCIRCVLCLRYLHHYLFNETDGTKDEDILDGEQAASQQAASPQPSDELGGADDETEPAASQEAASPQPSDELGGADDETEPAASQEAASPQPSDELGGMMMKQNQLHLKKLHLHNRQTSWEWMMMKQEKHILPPKTPLVRRKQSDRKAQA